MENIKRIRLNRSFLSKLIYAFTIVFFILIILHMLYISKYTEFYNMALAIFIIYCIFLIAITLSLFLDSIYITTNYIIILFLPFFIIKKIRLNNVISIELIDASEPSWNFEYSVNAYSIVYNTHTFTNKAFKFISKSKIEDDIIKRINDNEDV